LAEALLVAPPGQLPPRDWLLSLLSSQAALTPAERMALLSGRSPVPIPAVGRIVCSCFNVGVDQIAGAVASGCSTVDQIGAALRAGTNCGSCRSEIRAIVNADRLQAAE
jgi:assimilatory nitrate reductase catalytic subunit